MLAVLIVYQSHNLTSRALSADNINASFQFSLRGWACLSGSPCQKQKQNSSYQNYSNKRLVSLLRTRNEALPNRYNLKDPTFATVFKSLRFRRRSEDTYCSNTHKHIKKGLRFQKKKYISIYGTSAEQGEKEKQYIEQENWKLTKHGTNHQAARLGPLWLVGASETQMFIKFKEEKQIPKIPKSLRL